MRLQDYLTSTARHWVAVVISVLVLACGALGFGVLHPPSYTATAKDYVSVDLASDVNDLNLGGSYVQQVVGSYVDVATTSIVLKQVIQQLDLSTTPEQLKSQIQVTAPTASQVITVVATDSSPGRAADIANATSSSLATAVASLTPQIRSSGASVKVAQIEPATVSPKPTGPSILAQVLGGSLIGLLIGIGIAVLLELTNRRIRFGSDFATASELPVLGAVLITRDRGPASLSMQLDPWGESAESFRQLRTTILFGGPHPRVLAVSSPQEGKVKSVVAANLAVAFGDMGEPTVLIDADLRTGHLSRLLGQEDAPGLTDVLAGSASLEQALVPWGSGGLRVLSRGQGVANRSELLQSPAMTALISRFRDHFGFVVMDVSSILESTDGVVAAHGSDSALLVAHAGNTSKKVLTDAEATLGRVHVDLLGVVLADDRSLPRPGGARAKEAAPTQAAAPLDAEKTAETH